MTLHNLNLIPKCTEEIALKEVNRILKGGSGSGDFGHTGRAGRHGGSGGGGGKGRPRKGRRSREALDKEITERNKPKKKQDSSTDSRVTDDVRNLEFDRNIKKLHENFDSNEASIGTANDKVVDKIADASGISRWTVDGYVSNWNRGEFDMMHLTTQSSQRTLGTKLSSFENTKKDTWEKAIELLGLPDELKSDYDKITKAMYDETQRQFKDMGITEVVLYRGMHGSKSNIPVGNVGNYESNSLDSWTTDSSIANEFAVRKDNGFVMKTSMPVERIFSMSSSGAGTSDQREMMVLGIGSNDEVLIVS